MPAGRGGAASSSAQPLRRYIPSSQPAGLATLRHARRESAQRQRPACAGKGWRGRAGLGMCERAPATVRAFGSSACGISASHYRAPGERASGACRLCTGCAEVPTWQACSRSLQVLQHGGVLRHAVAGRRVRGRALFCRPLPHDPPAPFMKSHLRQWQRQPGKGRQAASSAPTSLRGRMLVWWRRRHRLLLQRRCD